MNKKLKILVTSIGSLVGRNILDVLESPLLKRRDMVFLVGTNSLASIPNNYRCDRCYLVPETHTEDFLIELNQIVQQEKPDLILSGRDEDTEVIAKYMETNKEASYGKTPYGEPRSLKAALDKWETWQFCQRNDLNFASSFVLNKSGDISDLRDFAESNGYPLIAKPIRGFASKGVYYVRSWKDLKDMSSWDNYIFQEYLGDGEQLQDYFRKMDNYTPLFAHAPNIFHYSCHTVIFQDGSCDKFFISKNVHESGATVGFKRVESEILESLALSFVKAIYREGGYGPITIQFRQNKNGVWKAQEVNMRTNGNTYPRFVLGQDDLGLIIRDVVPEADFPVYTNDIKAGQYFVGKELNSYPIVQDEINRLKADKVWQR